MPDSKRILVVGCGGVGGYFGGRLADASNQVEFLVRPGTASSYPNGTLHIQSDVHSDIDTEVKYTETPTPDAALIIIAVKANDLAAVLSALADAVGPETILVSLLNGVDSEAQIAAAFPNQPIIGGIAFIGTGKTAPGRIHQRSEGRLTLGGWNSTGRDVLEAVASLFETSGVRIKRTSEIQRELWTKLLWNAAFNTTSFLAGADVIDILRSPGGETLARTIMAEVVAVAAAEEIILPQKAVDDFIDHTYDLEWGTTSMRIDRECGKPIEAHSVVGTIVERAERYGVDVPNLRWINTLLLAYNATLNRR